MEHRVPLLPERRILVMSVPHTGTNFTLRLFRDRGFEDLNLFDRSSARRPSLHHAHIMKRTQIEPALRLAKEMPLVVPLRHPYWVEESWKRRGKDITLLLKCFREMIDVFGHAHFFRVDTPDREGELRALSDYVGVTLRTDWRPQASKQNTHDLPVDELDPSDPIKELAAGEFFSRFYPTIGETWAHEVENPAQS